MILVFENVANSDVLVYIFVIFLIIVSMMMIYLVYSQNKQLTQELMLRDKKHREEKKNQDLDLKSLTKELEAAPKEKNIELTKYEAEQEEKAIISYEELVNANKNLSINYSDTDELDNIVVKKVDLENTGKININEINAAMEAEKNSEPSEPVKVEESTPISVPNATYDHEEEFLKDLKQLQSSIN